MIESSHSQNLVCENDILIVDDVSDAEELTYIYWRDSIKKYLVKEGLWDILEDEDDEDASIEDDEDAGADDNEVTRAGTNEVVGVENNEVVRGDDNEVAAGAGTNEVAGAEDRDWIEKNAKALYLIMESCGSKRFSLISNIDSAKDAWRALRDAHAKELCLNYLQGSGSYSSPLRRKYTCSIILK